MSEDDESSDNFFTWLRVIVPGGAIATAQGTGSENLSSVAFSPGGKTLAAASTTGETFLLSAETGVV